MGETMQRTPGAFPRRKVVGAQKPWRPQGNQPRRPENSASRRAVNLLNVSSRSFGAEPAVDRCRRLRARPRPQTGSHNSILGRIGETAQRALLARDLIVAHRLAGFSPSQADTPVTNVVTAYA